MNNAHGDQLAEPIPDTTIEPAPPPFWSPWATVGIGVLVAIAFVLVQMVVMAVWAAIRLASEPDLDLQVLLESSGSDGDLLAWSTVATTIICSSLVWLAVKLKRGAIPRVALALDRPSWTQLWIWLAVTAGLIVISDTITILLGKPLVPEVMTDVFRTSSSLALIGVAITFGAPIFEELFFRGFLFEGLRRFPAGDVGAVVACSLFWAAIHVQYGPYEITSIFVFGLVLGLARVRTGSLWVPIAMHAMANLIATVEAMVILQSTELLPI